MSAMIELDAARDALATIPGVTTCAIGLEDVIRAEDYPIIRLVLVRIIPGKGYGARTAELLIYFGSPIAETQGLPAVYTGLLEMEVQVREKVRTLSGRYIETIADEDRISAFKLLAVRCELPVS